MILIIDDDPIVRESLKLILGSKGYTEIVVGNDGSEALMLYKKYKPDVLLLDIRMKEKSGTEAAKEVLAEFPDAKILLVTTFQDDVYISEALELGCAGYILKENIAGIAPAIEAVKSGQQVYDSKIIKKIARGALLENHDKYENFADLTAREKDVLELISKGLNNKEISERLFLAEGTVRNIISTMLEKLELRDRTQLAIYYLERKRQFS